MVVEKEKKKNGIRKRAAKYRFGKTTRDVWSIAVAAADPFEYGGGDGNAHVPVASVVPSHPRPRHPPATAVLSHYIYIYTPRRRRQGAEGYTTVAAAAAAKSSSSLSFVARSPFRIRKKKIIKIITKTPREK